MILKKFLIRFISILMPTKLMRQNVRNCLTVGFGHTHNRGGKNNKIVYIDKNNKKHTVKKLSGCKIYFYGDNNYIEIHGPLNALELEAQLLGNSKIVIQSSQFDKRHFKVLGMVNSELKIDKDFYINGLLFIEFNDNTKVHIGKNCVFSYDIIIRTGDGHQIRSLKTKKVINANKDVYIGNHVWVGCRTTILKGTKVSDNSIVGACSLVNKEFYKQNVILAGVPADIRKRDIQWIK